MGDRDEKESKYKKKKKKLKEGKRGKKGSKMKKKKKYKNKNKKVTSTRKKLPGVRQEEAPTTFNVSLTRGPYGYMHPDEIDWTEAKYRCPECEDTLIIYDPWYGPPPELHIPIVCTSNLTAFDASTDLQNFGPNITLIFIPGTLNCSNPERARRINNKQFSIEVTQGE